MRKPIENPHPKAPRKLVALYRKFDNNCYRLGIHLGINPGHIWNLLKYGREPRREDLRRKLFLSNKKSPEELERLRKLRQELKEKLAEEISQYYQEVMERLK